MQQAAGNTLAMHFHVGRDGPRRNRMTGSFTYTPIGVFRTSYLTTQSIPKTLGEAPTADAVIEVDPAYADGLLDIERFSHLLVLFAFHQSTARPLRVYPPGQTRERGVFATRSPHRPNAIGILTVELTRRPPRRCSTSSRT